MYESEESNIIKNWSEEVVVSISCICFNQINYIEETLIGFLKQKTTFRFEILIHDDASSDGTTELIRQYEIKYPHIIKPLYEIENQWSKGRRGSIVFNIPRAKGKYIALCEGDDYWIDTNKLQIQIEYLEKNPECGMCYTKTKQFYQNKKKFVKKAFGAQIGSFENLIDNGNRIPTLTSVFRKDLILQYMDEIKPELKNWMMSDFPMWLYISRNSRIKFLDSITACYRILENSASHNGNLTKKIDFLNSYWDIKDYFAKIYCYVLKKRDVDREIFNICVNLLKNYGYDKEYIKTLMSSYIKLERKSLRDFLNYCIVKNIVLLKIFY